jgi:hypothetical protein
MSLFGGHTNATQNSRLLGYRVQTSIAGSAIKLVFGTNRVPGNVIWTGDWQAQKADGKAGKGKYGGNYTYKTAGVVALCAGPISGIVAVWQNQTKNGQADTSWLNATSISDLGLTVLTGASGQSPWSYLTTYHPEQALGYSNIACVAKSDWDLGTSGVMPNFSYEVAGLNIYSGGQDALCTDVIHTLLTDAQLGAGFQTSEVDLSEVEAYCLANGIFVSPVLDSQKAASEWLNELLLIANAEAVWSEGVLKLRTRADSATTSTFGSFTPNTTPLVNLDENDFMDLDEPVRILRPDPRDACNSVKINWTNRGNQYNTEPLEEQDQAWIDTYGPHPASAIDALGICQARVAALVAQTQLKRNLYNRTRYKFKLGFAHILLEPMDIVTLTCRVDGITYQGLDHTSVRLLSIEEDADGYLSCEAEEMPAGSGTATVNPKQTVGGFAAPLNADPGNVNTPIFYEAAPRMTETLGVPYALLIALSGGPYWGGCTVWRSYDGTTYQPVGRQVGATPMGSLSASLASGSDPDSTNTCSVNLLESFGMLSSVSMADADNDKTLFLVNSELMSYETATLTSSYNYDLTYLRRGVYGSTIASHASAAAFCMLNGRAFEWDYQSQDLGKTIYFKFTSFNQYGGAEQSLADVTAYTYTLSGSLSGVKTVTSDYAVQPGDTTINVDASAGPVTITLPPASTMPNAVLTITKIDSSANTVTIVGPISGNSSVVLTTQYQSITVESTPSGWIQVGVGSAASTNYADNETPSGALNGSNQTFTLAHTPSPAGSLQLYWNGDLQLSGVDYTLSGSTITLLIAHPDTSQGDWLRCSYRY